MPVHEGAANDARVNTLLCIMYLNLPAQYFIFKSMCNAHEANELCELRD